MREAEIRDAIHRYQVLSGQDFASAAADLHEVAKLCVESAERLEVAWECYERLFQQSGSAENAMAALKHWLHLRHIRRALGVEP